MHVSHRSAKSYKDEKAVAYYNKLVAKMIKKHGPGEGTGKDPGTGTSAYYTIEDSNRGTVLKIARNGRRISALYQFSEKPQATTAKQEDIDLMGD